MRILAPALLALILTLSGPAFAQDAACQRGDLAQSMTRVERYFQNAPARELFTTQLLIREGTGHPDISADGQWGPMTRQALCDLVITLNAINGETTIYSQNDVAGFVDWISALAFSNVTGAEAPD